MLSICIPSYNFDLSRLINELVNQVEFLDAPCEIIVIDDASDIEYRQKLNALDKIQFLQLDQNIGRSCIRNLFLKYAQYSHLLFLDADSLVTNKSFLQEYLHAINQFPNAVICGGRVYPQLKPTKNKVLSWKYGHKRESKTKTERSLFPYDSFMTNNFIVPKSVLQVVQFDERIKLYGHEDTLFGIELKLNDIPIKHIDNSILNGDIETNEIFIRKTEQGIQNLIEILRFKNFDNAFIQSVTILRKYQKLVLFSALLQTFYLSMKRLLINQLKGNNPSIFLFNLYKLLLLNHNLRKMNLTQCMKSS